MKLIKDIAIFIFGTNQKQRFKRIAITLLLVAFFFIMSFNISCGIDSKGNFYFNWDNIDTKVEIKK